MDLFLGTDHVMTGYIPSSEASNLQSASTSHDLYSENAENKAKLTASVTCNASEDIDMPRKVSSGEAAGDQLPSRSD